jgi:hypothetical protein
MFIDIGGTSVLNLTYHDPVNKAAKAMLMTSLLFSFACQDQQLPFQYLPGGALFDTTLTNEVVISIGNLEVMDRLVTLDDYNRCVSAEACVEVNEDQCADQANDTPLTCINRQQMMQFAKYHQSRLPTELELRYLNQQGIVQVGIETAFDEWSDLNRAGLEENRPWCNKEECDQGPYIALQYRLDQRPNRSKTTEFTGKVAFRLVRSIKRNTFESINEITSVNSTLSNVVSLMQIVKSEVNSDYPDCGLLAEIASFSYSLCNALRHPITTGRTNSSSRKQLRKYLKNKGLRKFRGFIVGEIGRNQYEVAKLGYNDYFGISYPTSKHLILNTKLTNYNSRGNFVIWVEKTGTKAVNTSSGFQTWDVYTESILGEYWQAVRKAKAGYQTADTARSLLIFLLLQKYLREINPLVDDLDIFNLMKSI